MKASEILSKRTAAKIKQDDFARQLKWPQDALRAVEIGLIDVTEQQVNVLNSELEELITEKERAARKKAKATA